MLISERWWISQTTSQLISLGKAALATWLHFANRVIITSIFGAIFAGGNGIISDIGINA
jgi:hypothetical protein